MSRRATKISPSRNGSLLAGSRPATEQRNPNDASLRSFQVLAIVLGRLPSPTAHEGVPVITWSVVKWLKERGHRVSVCTLDRLTTDEDHLSALDALKAHDIDVYDLDEELGQSLRTDPSPAQRFRRALRPHLQDFYPGYLYADQVSRLVQRLEIDVIYVFDFNGIASTHHINGVRKLAAVVNLDHVAQRIRRKDRRSPGWKGWVVDRLQAITDLRLPSVEVSLLRGCDAVICHAAHHADWLRKKGVARCVYLPNPVSDRPGTTWRERRSWEGTGRVLFIGWLNTAINAPAVRLLAEEIVPILNTEFAGRFHLRIVGRGDVPPDIARRLDHPSVTFAGFVPEVEDEFFSADVVIVPTPGRLGFRTRVAEAFSYGCCVVSHEANRLGMPELRHEENVLLGRDGAELAEMTMRALTDDELRSRLGVAARQTYDDDLHPRVVCGAIVDQIEALAW